MLEHAHGNPAMAGELNPWQDSTPGFRSQKLTKNLIFSSSSVAFLRNEGLEEEEALGPAGAASPPGGSPPLEPGHDGVR